MEEWNTLADFAKTLTVATVLIVVLYIIVDGRLHTRQHTEDIVRAQEVGHAAVDAARAETIANLREELSRALAREEEARRELAENNAVLARLDVTIREALTSLRRR